MNPMRAFLLRHRALALLVVLAALCMKIAVPAGFMPTSEARVFTIQICADASGGLTTARLVVPSDAGSESAPHGGQGKQSAAAECPFAQLSLVSLAATDVALLASALAFILLLGFAPVRLALPRRTFHLRPPLRGPPAFA